MKRVAFTMKLKAGCEAEYKKRHDEIWPELVRTLEVAGVSDYSIFLDPDTLTLFAVQKVGDGEDADALPSNPVVQRWWSRMTDVMETNPDHSPISIPLREVFHMD